MPVVGWPPAARPKPGPCRFDQLLTKSLYLPSWRCDDFAVRLVKIGNGTPVAVCLWHSLVAQSRLHAVPVLARPLAKTGSRKAAEQFSSFANFL